MEPIIAWDAPEHLQTEKNADWYWAVGIIAFTAAALAIMFGQVIFGILIIISAVALALHSSVAPRTIHCEINDRGVILDDRLYPFLNLESFWIDPNHYPPLILIKSRKTFVPYLKIYIPDDIDPEAVRQILLTYIAETEHLEPFTLKLMERLGF
jgi:hypothetical protein